MVDFRIRALLLLAVTLSIELASATQIHSPPHSDGCDQLLDIDSVQPLAQITITQTEVAQFYQANLDFWRRSFYRFWPQSWRPVELKIEDKIASRPYFESSSSSNPRPMDPQHEVSFFWERTQKNLIFLNLPLAEILFKEILKSEDMKGPYFLFVLSHEFAHHVQSLLRPPPIPDPFSFWSSWFGQSKKSSPPQSTPKPCNGILCYELQADCLAGYFMSQHQRLVANLNRFKLIDIGPLISEMGGDSEHGSGVQRRASFEFGFRSTDLQFCLDPKNLQPIINWGPEGGGE